MPIDYKKPPEKLRCSEVDAVLQTPVAKQSYIDQFSAQSGLPAGEIESKLDANKQDCDDVNKMLKRTPLKRTISDKTPVRRSSPLEI